MIAAELEVLGRVDGATPLPEEHLGVLGRDDPADHHRGVDPFRTQAVEDLGDQLEVGAREDREPDHVDVLVAGGRDDLGRA